MAVFPIFYAVIENDLRRVLCYSKINQIGFMVVAVGIGSGWQLMEYSSCLYSCDL